MFWNKKNTKREEDTLDVIEEEENQEDTLDTIEEEEIKEDIISNKEEDLVDIVGEKEELNVGEEIMEDFIEKDLKKGPKKDGFFKKIFGKKEKDKKQDIIEEEEIKEDTGKSNIFEDFDLDSELGKEVKGIQKNLNKDTYDYILNISNIIKYINILIVLIIIVLFSYIYIQENDSEKFRNSTLLDPICPIILGNSISYDNICSSLAVIAKESSGALVNSKKDTFLDEIKILPSVYKKENFLNSKEIIFLLEKGTSRLRPLEILSKFDTLKNDFLGIGKDKILCNNISINKDSILNMSCYSQSSNWSKRIPISKDGKKESIDKNIHGTSISLAASFLDFLEKQDSEISGLSLINKQKVFSIENVFNDYGSYTQKTPFSIKMKYSLRKY